MRAEASPETYRFLIEATNTAFVILDERGVVLEANAEYVRLTGRERLEEVLGRPVTEWTAPHDRERNAVEVRRCLETGSVRGLEIDYAGKDGQTVTVEINATVQPGPPALRIFSVCRDVTGRKRMAESLRESREQLSALSANLADGMVYQINSGRDGTLREFSFISAAVERFHGISVAAVRADPSLLYEQVLEEDRPLVVEREALAFAARRKLEVDVRVRLPSGEVRWRRFASAPRTAPDGCVLWDGIELDITEQKEAEERLRRSEERFRTLADSLPLAVFEMDLQERLTYVNRAGIEMFGYSPADVAGGLTLAQVLAPADRGRARETIARRFSSRMTGYVEYQGLRKDGSVFPITVASSPVFRDGRPSGLRGIVTDLTERKQLETERVKSQKLESIGTLAGGIAHDFNNLLQGVFGYVSLAKMNLDKPQEAAALLREAEKAMQQAVRLTSQLLTFSKGGRPSKRVIAPGPVIASAVRFALSGSRAEYALALAEDLAAIEADEGQITQVIQNVVLNAGQAMPRGGRIEIAARNARDATGGAGGIEITVRDQGPGIPREALERIFDPYFTTKERGSGLGLATAYSIVTNHGGSIVATSEAGKGATFTITLPATAGAPEAPAPEPERKPARGGRILVMDDEPAVCDVTRALVLRLGHAVECVENGEAAIEKYREAMAAGRGYDVVILDLTVRGGLGGRETLEALRAIDPGVRAVVSSGYSADAALSCFEQYGFLACLRKPYDLATLRSVLDRLIGALPPGGAA